MLGLPELVIELATLAIMESADDWRSQVQPFLSLFLQEPLPQELLAGFIMDLCCFQATLRTCIFKHHLDLGHNSEAYVALTQNPDPGR